MDTVTTIFLFAFLIAILVLVVLTYIYVKNMYDDNDSEEEEEVEDIMTTEIIGEINIAPTDSKGFNSAKFQTPPSQIPNSNPFL